MTSLLMVSISICWMRKRRHVIESASDYTMNELHSLARPFPKGRKCACVCVLGVILDDTLINTLSSPRALWIPLRKTLHDHLPPSQFHPEWCKHIHTRSRAHTEAYVPTNMFSHKSRVRTRVTRLCCRVRKAHTHMLHGRTHMLHEAHRVWLQVAW